MIKIVKISMFNIASNVILFVSYVFKSRNPSVKSDTVVNPLYNSSQSELLLH